MIDLDRDRFPRSLPAQHARRRSLLRATRRAVSASRTRLAKTSSRNTPWGAMGDRVLGLQQRRPSSTSMLTDMHSDMSETFGRRSARSSSPTMQWPEKPSSQTVAGTTSSATPSTATCGRRRQDSTRSRRASVPRTTGRGGLSPGDLNADGFEDVFIASSMNYPVPLRVNTRAAQQHAGKRFARQRVHPGRRAAQARWADS